MNVLNENQIRRRAERVAASREYASKRFGIPETEIVDYNSGCCYDKIWVTNTEAANKVAKAVRGETVNGGCFDEMPLGNIHFDGKCYEVMC